MRFVLQLLYFIENIKLTLHQQLHLH